MGSVVLPLLAPERLAFYLQIGGNVEVVEPDRLAIVEAVVQDVRIGEGIVVVQPTSREFAGNTPMLVERSRVRPCSQSPRYDVTNLQSADDKFRIYNSVEVLIEGRWLLGVIVHVPIGIHDSYRVRIFRDDHTICVSTAMREHEVWDNMEWTRECEREQQRLRSSKGPEVGYVGSYKAKILQFLSDDHMLVEYLAVTHSDGTHLKEVINRNKWHQSLLGKWWEQLISWISANQEPIEEFACYMPAYICLCILGLITPILLTDSAQSWQDNKVLVFFSLGGISFFLCLFVLVGFMCRQPKTGEQLNKFRRMCLIAVATGVAFMCIHAFNGPK